jgi:glycosyltransferase involved in cell wall biosynthesis
MKKMKVMQIMPRFVLAGAEIMGEHLAIALADNSLDVSVISLYDYQSPITKRLEENGVPVFYLEKKLGFDIKIINRLYKLFKEQKPDVIHTHLYIMPYVIPAAILARVPVRVHTIHNIAEKEVGTINRKFSRFFYKFCRVRPVSISPLVQESVMEEYGLQPAKVNMIYNGIDLNKCIPKKNYKTKEKIILLHIGRFSEQKNHMELIESFKIVHDSAPNAVLRLIGSGELEPGVRERVKELNLEECVEFLGLKSNVHKFLAEADIFVLPSLWEGMPMTLIEAMATGLPIVAAEVGGIPDMIKDNTTGLLVSPHRESISEALLRFIGDYRLRENMGNAAKIASKQFSSQEMAKQYIGVYKKEKN